MSDTDGVSTPRPDPTEATPAWSAPGSAPGSTTGPTTGPTAGSTPGPVPAPATGAGHAGYGPPAGTPSAPTGTPTAPWSTALTAHKPGIIALRPLGFGDILEGSFAAMRRNPKTFFGLALLTSLAVLLLLAAVAALGYLVVTQVGSSDVADVVLAIGTVGGLTLLYVASAVTAVALTGMLSYPVGEAVLGRTPSIAETWRRTRGMLGRLTGLCLILFFPVVIVFGGLVTLVVVAFDSGSDALGAVGIVALVLALLAVAYVAVRLALATPALVLEELGVVASLRRSWGLTRGRFWRTLGVLFVASLIVSVVQQVLSVGFQLVGGALGLAVVSSTGEAAGEGWFLAIFLGVTVIGSLLASLIAQPFLAAVGALLYTDARIRKEGFDLALVRAATGAQVVG